MFIPAKLTKERCNDLCRFQSRDWVDVYSGLGASRLRRDQRTRFQSRDWVDVYSGILTNSRNI